MASGSYVRIKATQVHLDAKSLNRIIEEVVGRKVESVTKHPELRKTIGRIYIEHVTPYVPMKSGKLRDSAWATDDGRVHWTAQNLEDAHHFNYANIQYTNEYNNYTTPGTGPYWTDKVSPDNTENGEWASFVQDITPCIIKEVNNGNGQKSKTG